jgi:hypothetical protein
MLCTIWLSPTKTKIQGEMSLGYEQIITVLLLTVYGVWTIEANFAMIFVNFARI